MRILFTSDWHLDLPVRGGLDRWPDLERQVARIEAAVAEHEPDLFVHGGDVADPDSGPRTVRAIRVMRELYRRVPCRKVQMAGNHDVIDDASFLQSARSVVSALEDEHVHVVEDPELFKFERDGVAILFVPYVSSAHCRWTDDGGVERRTDAVTWIDARLRNLLEGERDVVAFTHLDVDGAVVGSEERMLRGGRLPIPRWFEEDPRVRLIVAGHVHKHQRVREKILIVGSFECVDFGERDDAKGFAVIEV